MSINALTLQMVFEGEDRTGNAIQSVEESIRGMSEAAQMGSDSIEQQSQALMDATRVARTHQRLENSLRLSLFQAHEEFFQGTKIIGGFGNAALKANSIITSFNVTQIRGQQITEDLADAEIKLAEAVRGGNRDDIIRAQKRVNDLKKQQLDFERQLPFQYLAQGLSALSLASDIGRLTLETQTFMKARSLGLFGHGAARGAEELTGALRGAKGAGGVGGTAATVAATGLAGFGSKLKSFAGSTAGKVLLPLAAGVGTYEFLTQDETGKEINKYNPFTMLFNSIFAATHTPGEVALAQAQRAAANGEAPSGIMPGAYGAQGGNGMNLNGPVSVYVNSATPQQVQTALENYGNTYR